MKPLFCCIPFVFLFTLFPGNQPKSSATLHDKIMVGFGKREITPKIGAKPIYLAGFGHNRIATGVNDPLFIKAAVIKSGGRKIALCCADLVGLFLHEVESIRASCPGLDYIMVSCTHNHEGPDTMGIWGSSPFKSGLDQDYQETVRKKTVEAIREAESQLEETSTELGQGKFPDLIHDGREPIIKMDELTVLKFQSAKTKKNQLGILFWHCHPETLASKNTLISADFTGFTSRHLETKWNCETMVFSGAVGGLMTQLNLPVRDNNGNLLKDGTFEKTMRYGSLVGDAAQIAMKKSKMVSLAPIQVKTTPLYLPVDNPIYQLAWQLGVFRRDIFDWNKANQSPSPLKSITGTKPCLKTELAFIQIGELGIACIPGEIYPELALGLVTKLPIEGADYPNAPIEPGIYQSMPSKYKTLIGLANDEVGYIVPKRQWDAAPPFTFGQKKAPYGEINSLGPETSKLLGEAWKELLLKQSITFPRKLD